RKTNRSAGHGRGLTSSRKASLNILTIRRRDHGIGHGGTLRRWRASGCAQQRARPERVAERALGPPQPGGPSARRRGGGDAPAWRGGGQAPPLAPPQLVPHTARALWGRPGGRAALGTRCPLGRTRAAVQAEGWERWRRALALAGWTHAGLDRRRHPRATPPGARP